MLMESDLLVITETAGVLSDFLQDMTTDIMKLINTMGNRFFMKEYLGG